MTRLLFIGLWNFADDGGVQPLKPRTIRMQVFPGDAIGNDAVRAMIDELAAQGLVLTYAVDGVEYVAIVDWDQLQRVGKRARRRYPAVARSVPGTAEAGDEASRTIENHSNGETPQSPLPPPSPAGPSAAPTCTRRSRRGARRSGRDGARPGRMGPRSNPWNRPRPNAGSASG